MKTFLIIIGILVLFILLLSPMFLMGWDLKTFNNDKTHKVYPGPSKLINYDTVILLQIAEYISAHTAFGYQDVFLILRHYGPSDGLAIIEASVEYNKPLTVPTYSP